MEEEAYKYFKTIEGMGGVVNSIKNGYLQREIAATAYAHQKKVESGEMKIVGVNAFVKEDEQPINVLKIDLKAERIQRKRLQEVRLKRNNSRVQKSLERLREVYSGDENSMEAVIEAVKNYATLEEITNVGREVFGGWKEPTIV
jgi:methylmalonyl-CoA mutase N-terminal domain/subunit